MKEYDYIISGAGAAGLSLLMRMMATPAFLEKRILVIDKAPKQGNDRTWCFWENKQGLFESIVHHQWNSVHFFSNQFSRLIDLSPYHYKMIRSKDFYHHVQQQAVTHTNIQFRYGTVGSVGSNKAEAWVMIDGEKIVADYVFNSILLQPVNVPPKKHYLLQHFKGFFIKTTAPVFNADIATLMDFRISQKHGTAFVYVLPFSTDTALVEYTLFTKQLLKDDEYVSELNHYIKQYLHVDTFAIMEEEFGIIPMTNVKFSSNEERVTYIGTAGGQTKGSSGYTFQFIQKHSEKIVDNLLKKKSPANSNSFFQKRFSFYDATLLNILATNKYPSDKIFAIMFEKNPIDSVLRFLDNESSLKDDIKIMSTLPKRIFMKAALEEMFK